MPMATIAHTQDALERAKRKYEEDTAGKHRKAEILHLGDKEPATAHRRKPPTLKVRGTG